MEYNDEDHIIQPDTCGRVPSDWLSLPRVKLSSMLTVPPCSKDACEMIYGPINGNPQRLDVRIIEIEEVNDEYGRLSCLLRPYPLHQTPRFRALSYCWSDGPASSIRRIILLNGLEFSVQLNLWVVLEMMRSRGYTTVWADAICLNQQDEEERAQQTPHMRLIYQRAIEVMIWLGNEADGSAEFLDVLKGISKSDGMQIIRAYKQSEVPVHRDENRDIFPAAIRVEFAQACLLQSMIPQLELAGAHISDDERAYMWTQAVDHFAAQQKAFFERPYWRRTWIVQEVASARVLRILCGDREVDWKDLTSLLVMDDGIIKWDDNEDRGSLNLCMIDRLRYKITNRIPIGYLTALQRTYGCEASDSRDKFYALLGLCWDAEHLVPYVSYAKEVTLNRIMFDLMRQWTDAGNLDIICLQPYICDNIYDVPSWLPKWLTVGRSMMSERLVNHIENRRPAALLSTHGHSWRATQRTQAVPRFDDHDRIMEVEGVVIDVIDGLSAACDHLSRDVSLQRCWHSTSLAPDTVNHMKRIRRDLYDTINMYKERHRDSMADQTLSLDCLFSEEAISYWQKQGFDYHIEWLERIRDFRIFGRPFHQWLLDRPKQRNLAKVKIHNYLLKDKNDKVDLTVHNKRLVVAFGEVFDDLRRLMTTKNGRIGWAHPNARPGDLIALLKGCNLPVILARSGLQFCGRQTYAVVGDAYVQGIMQGELWPSACQHLSKILLR